MKPLRSLVEVLAARNDTSNPVDDTNSGEEEMEMPSSSTVVHNDNEIFNLLAGESNETTQQENDNETIIELYSTIAFLKKQNQELTKDVEFSRASKDASIKNEDKLKNENLRLRNELSNLDMQLKNSNEEMKRLYADLEAQQIEIERLKEYELRAADSSHREEIFTQKSENNKLKMEIAQIRAECDRLLQQQSQKSEEEMKTVVQQCEMEIEKARNEAKIANEQVSIRAFFDQYLFKMI